MLVNANISGRLGASTRSRWRAEVQVEHKNEEDDLWQNEEGDLSDDERGVVAGATQAGLSV